jgi:hypothetical protein
VKISQKSYVSKTGVQSIGHGKIRNPCRGPEKIPAECEDEKLENVLPAPENKNREKRVWAIAQDYLHGVTFKVTAPGPLRREHKKRGAYKHL